jgi:catechol 2,3-dioxygenase-like lactoylglutathione lyase family enzyme
VAPVTSYRLTGIHHVQLAMPAGEEERAERFYTGVLGLQRVAKPETLAGRGGAWFRGDGVEVHLGVEDAFQPARKAHPAFLVDGLGMLERRLAEAGAPVRPDEPFEHRRRLHTDDPFGNRIELIEREASP